MSKLQKHISKLNWHGRQMIRGKTQEEDYYNGLDPTIIEVSKSNYPIFVLRGSSYNPGWV